MRRALTFAATLFVARTWEARALPVAVEYDLQAFNEYTRAEVDADDDGVVLSWKTGGHRFSRLAEPHRATTLRLVRLEPYSVEESVESWTVNGASVCDGEAECVVTFTAADMGWAVVEAGLKTAGEETARSIAFTIMVKYVRREIRRLTTEDREKFIHTTRMLVDIDMEEGSQLYGERFRSMHFLQNMHINKAAQKDCDLWHDGPAFAITHVAFTLIFEQSLQSIDPSITVPYWDYTLDMAFYNETTWRQSSIWHDDLFGMVPLSETDSEFRTSGVWAYQKIAEAYDSETTRNAYGLLRAPWNTDKTPYVTRYYGMYGFNEPRGPLGCDATESCLLMSTWSDIAMCLNSQAHGHVHDLVGGAVKSGHDFDQNDIQDSNVTSAENFLHLSVYLSKLLWRADYLQCPSMCTADTAQEDCICTCSTSDTSAHDVLKSSGILAKLAMQSDTGLSLDARGDYHIGGKTREEETVIWAGLLDNLCDMGKIGDMFSASSPADISFWVIHPTIDRLMHLIKMKDIIKDFTWVGVEGCSAHDEDYIQEDFDRSMFLDIEGSSSDTSSYVPTKLTNKMLFDLMDPKDDDHLPYVYDNIEYSHCKMLGYTAFPDVEVTQSDPVLLTFADLPEF